MRFRCALRLFAALFSLVAAPAFADALDDIASSGRMKLGYRTDAPPFSSRNPEGKPEGLAVDLCREAAIRVAQALDLETLELDYVPVTASDRFEALAGGRIHLLCGPTTQTLSRREEMDFSIPYFIDGASLVYRAGLVRDLASLDGEVVGVLNGTTTEIVAARILQERGVSAQLRGFSRHDEGLKALEAGEIVAYFGDQAILRYQIGALRPSTPIVFSPEQYSFEPYALAMKRGEDRLRLAVDRALSETFESGAIFSLIAGSLGEVDLSDTVLAVYQVVTLPE